MANKNKGMTPVTPQDIDQVNSEIAQRQRERSGEKRTNWSGRTRGQG